MNETTPARNAARSETWFTCDSNTPGSAPEQRLDGLLEDLRRGDAHELLHDLSLAVQNEGRGNARDAAVLVRGVVVGQQHRVVDGVLLGEGRDHAPPVRIQGEPHDL